MNKVIAIDFDGCLCVNQWPEIGEPIQATIDRMREEQSQGTQFILWTCRDGETLDAAVKWCAEHGLTFDAINQNLQWRIDLYGTDPRKVGADEYWDDKAVKMG